MSVHLLRDLINFARDCQFTSHGKFVVSAEKVLRRLVVTGNGDRYYDLLEFLLLGDLSIPIYLMEHWRNSWWGRSSLPCCPAVFTFGTFPDDELVKRYYVGEFGSDQWSVLQVMEHLCGNAFLEKSSFKKIPSGMPPEFTFTGRGVHAQWSLGWLRQAVGDRDFQVASFVISENLFTVCVSNSPDCNANLNVALDREMSTMVEDSPRWYESRTTWMRGAYARFLVCLRCLRVNTVRFTRSYRSSLHSNLRTRRCRYLLTVPASFPRYLEAWILYWKDILQNPRFNTWTDQETDLMQKSQRRMCAEFGSVGHWILFLVAASTVPHLSSSVASIPHVMLYLKHCSRIPPEQTPELQRLVWSLMSTGRAIDQSYLKFHQQAVLDRVNAVSFNGTMV